MPISQYKAVQNGYYRSCQPVAIPGDCHRGKQGMPGWTGPAAVDTLVTYGTGGTAVALPTDAKAGMAVVLYDTLLETLHFGTPSA